MTETYDPEKRFNKRASTYDNEIESIIPGYRALHDISHHILRTSLPHDAFVLVGGSGTGKESIGYAVENPDWKITGFDIAEEMIKKAASKVQECGLSGRIELVHGGIGDIMQQDFDGATSLLVAHFIPKPEKEEFIRAISFRLKPGATFILADVCNDRDAGKFEDFVRVWESYQLQSRDKEEVEEMFTHVRENLNYITVDEEIEIFKRSGFVNIQHFWKSLLINGFVMEKGV